MCSSSSWKSVKSFARLPKMRSNILSTWLCCRETCAAVICRAESLRGSWTVSSAFWQRHSMRAWSHTARCTGLASSDGQLSRVKRRSEGECWWGAPPAFLQQTGSLLPVTIAHFHVGVVLREPWKYIEQTWWICNVPLCFLKTTSIFYTKVLSVALWLFSSRSPGEFPSALLYWRPEESSCWLQWLAPHPLVPPCPVPGRT